MRMLITGKGIFKDLIRGVKIEFGKVTVYTENTLIEIPSSKV